MKIKDIEKHEKALVHKIQVIILITKQKGLKLHRHYYYYYIAEKTDSILLFPLFIT